MTIMVSAVDVTSTTHCTNISIEDDNVLEDSLETLVLGLQGNVSGASTEVGIGLSLNPKYSTITIEDDDG